MTERDFRQVQQELEEVFSKLKAATRPEMRRALLREMRVLLAEADRIIRDMRE